MATKKKSTNEELQKQHLNLNEVTPLNSRQRDVFDGFDQGSHLVLSGSAGTGKSFLALYLSLKELMTKNSPYKKIIVIRSAVPTRDLGFVPGTLEEKSKVYQDPYKTIVNELMGRGDSWYLLTNKEIIEFQTTSFLRGLTFTDCIIIFDEFQSATFHEIDTVLTRIGENCRFILCGDFCQNDLSIKREKSGFEDAIRILRQIDHVKEVKFTIDDVVRSGFVREYLKEKERQGL